MFLKEVEKVIAEQGENGLIQLEFYYGQQLKLLRQVKSGAYSKVYGIDAGQPTQEVCEFIGVLQGDDFFESNSTHRPGFEAGFLYTRMKDVIQGDVIEIMTDDSTGRKYKVTKVMTIGITQQVFKKFKLSSIGD